MPYPPRLHRLVSLTVAVGFLALSSLDVEARPKRAIERVVKQPPSIKAPPDLPTVAAHYEFHGNADDSGPRRAHGTVEGATLGADRSGCANEAYEFDGDDEISFPVSFDREHFTIEMDVRIDEHPEGRPYCPAPCGVGRRAIWSWGTMHVEMGDWGGGASYTYLGAGWRSVEGNWVGTYGKRIRIGKGYHHIVVVYDAPTFAVYVNGELKATSEIEAPLKPAEPMRLGQGSGVDFVGAFDFFRILNRPLSDEEVATRYANLKKPKECPVQPAPAKLPPIKQPPPEPPPVKLPPAKLPSMHKMN